MPDNQISADFLRRLPRKTRAWIYGVFAAIGAVLTLMQQAGVDSLGSFSMEQLLAAYTALVPFLGGYAAVNTKPAAPDEDAYDGYGEDDTDVSSFEPVGDPDAVYS